MLGFQGCIIIFLTGLVFTIFLRTIVNKNKTKARLPGPTPLPIIGHLHLLTPIPRKGLYNLSTRYGPLIHIFLGSIPTVVVSSPEVAKEILKTHETSFSDRPKVANIEYLADGSTDFIFAPYGSYWRFMRKICMSELLTTQMLDQFQAVRYEEVRWFLLSILKKANANEAVDVGRYLIRLTNNVIARMTMSQKCADDEANEVRKLVQEITELAGKFNLSDYIWFCKNLDLQGFRRRVKEVRLKFDIMMERIIREHAEAKMMKNGIANGDKDRKDLLDVLLDISDDDNSEMKITRTDIKVFIMDIFTAATDTSALTMEWAMAELINNPDVKKKAREEIETVVGKTRIVEESDTPNLPYLRAILKETLRLHPTAPIFFRQSTKSCNVAGYEIPAGTRTLINAWAIGRNPEHWDNPLKFFPERFTNLEGNGKSQVNVRGQHFELLPFGSGRRGCLGTSLALEIMHTCLGAAIQCFDWKIPGENNKVNMEEGPGITLARAHPLICTPVAKLNPFPSL